MKHTPEEIKNRLSNIGEAIGGVALEYIADLEKENVIFKKANEIIAQQRDGRDADISKLENQIEDLEAQIKKMKCCYNCEHGHNECYCSIKHSDICDLSCWDCGCDKWEIKENG